MDKCIYYDKKLDICKLHSDWSDAMPVLQPCVEGACGDYKPLTNYDRIRNMSVCELVNFINHNYKCRNCAYYNKCCNGECESGIKQWLESEVEE